MRKRRLLSAGLAMILLAAGCGRTAAPSGTDTPGRTADPDGSIAALSPADERFGAGLCVAAEDGRSLLLLDTATLRLGLIDKATERGLWSSPAADEISGDSEETKNTLCSQIVLHYVNAQEKQETLCSYGDAVLKQQFSVTAIKNGVRIDYILGERYPTDVFPDVLTAETMDDLLSRMDEDGQALIARNFTLYDLAQTEQDVTDELRTRFLRLSADDKVYVARNVSVKIRDRVASAVRDAGLTAEALQAEYERLGYDKTLKTLPSFYVPVEYTLQNGALTARIPCSELRYDNEILTRIELLPYWGSAGADESGSLLLPDGCGTLIDFDRQNTGTLSLPLYGEDANTVEDTAALKKEDACLPVYGFLREGLACLATIDRGDAQATLNAESCRGIAGRAHVAPSFEIRRRVSLSPRGVVSGAAFVRYGAKAYDGDLQITFSLLTGGDADLFGMVERCRAWLFDVQRPAYDGFALIDTYGVVRRSETLAQIPVERDRALTTFAQLAQILQDGGLHDVLVRYRGFSSDELHGALRLNAEPSALLGSAGDLDDLRALMQKNEIRLFPSVPVMFTGGGRSPDLDRKKQTALTTENGYAVERFDKNDPDKFRYTVAPAALAAFAPKLTETLSDGRFDGLALPDVGRRLATDYNKRAYADRTAYRDAVCALLSDLRGAGGSLIAEGANAYVLTLADVVTDVPFSSSSSSLESEEVPFLPLVLNGNVSFAGEAVNLSDDPQLCVLRAAECGAMLRYTIDHESALLLRGTDHSDLFRTGRDVILPQLRETLQRYQTYAAAIRGAQAVGHERRGDLRITTFSNGCTVAVNYGTSPVDYDGHTVEARDYAYFN